MKIAILEISPEELAFSFHSGDWLPAEVEAVGDVQASLGLSRNGARVLAVGSLDLRIRENCDRCLADFILPLTASFKINFELGGQDQLAREHSCRVEEMETEFLQGSEIDLHQLLQQQFYLATPVKALCSEDCKGLCSGCGGDLNRNFCRCERESSAAFGVLRTLLK